MSINWKMSCVGVDCEADLEMSQERFDRDGNYCIDCITKASRNIKQGVQHNDMLIFSN